MRLYTGEAMRAVDEKAVQLGYPSLLLMEAAGRAVAKSTVWAYPNRRLVVLCGKGNNGGDGLVAARWLEVWGAEVEVYAAEGQQGDAGLARAALQAHGVGIKPLEAWNPQPGSVVIDALFGTGLKGRLEGVWADLVEKINGSRLPVVAVDVPSGVPHSPRVQASLTVTFAGLKNEHLFYPSRAACGQILLDSIGMPPEALQDPALPELLTPGAMRDLLPTRLGNANKGSVGRVLVVGGYATYTGAPTLSALAAARAGAGLVTVAYPENSAVHPPLEAIRMPVPEWSFARLKSARAEAVAVGMGAGPEGAKAALAALELRLPTVLDADALHPEAIDAYVQAKIPTVITPHPGEAGRLLDKKAAEVAERPLEFASVLAKRFPGVAVVLKGGPTVVAEGGGQRAEGTQGSQPSALCLRLGVNTTGNPAMATGGAGDVLSGIVAAYLAAGLSPWDAARLGVYLHGLSGDLVGKVGLLAHEIAEHLPEAVQRLHQGTVRGFWEEGSS